MAKVLLFSDLHVHPHKKNYQRVEHCLEVVDWIFDTAKEHEVSEILFGGDLFHDRKAIDVPTYQATFEKFHDLLIRNPHIKLYLLLGNHDIWLNEKSTISSVFPFSALPGVTVISNPQRLEIAGTNWDFIPFTHNPVETLSELSKLPGKPQYALGHIAVNNAILHGRTFSENISIEHDGDMMKVDSAIFSNYKRTFLGHYHVAQVLDYKVEYIGSPLELNFGEAGEEKHIIVFNCDSNNCNYIENNFSPKHRKEQVTNVDDFLKNTDDLKNGFVKIVYDPTTVDTVDALRLRREIESMGECLSFELVPKKIEIDKHQIEDASSILNQEKMTLSRYVDQVGDKGLDRDKLIEIGQFICNG
jgi:DNA repair exonuclease SbcCD nuclease subunit